MSLSLLLLLAAAGFYAGAQNALAGGGSFITFPALVLAGLDPLSANITSTIALFPSQITSALTGRKLVGDVSGLRFRHVFAISVAGGIAGALLLLNTSPSVFARLVPWLILFATTVFAWGSFRKKPLDAEKHAVPAPAFAAIQACIAVYGGYFGGGIGFLMLAALTFAGQPVRTASATKNALAMAMNASAVLLFVFSGKVNWMAAMALGAGGIAGGFGGARLIHWLPEKALRGFVVIVGIVLTAWMFLR